MDDTITTLSFRIRKSLWEAINMCESAVAVSHYNQNSLAEKIWERRSQELQRVFTSLEEGK